MHRPELIVNLNVWHSGALPRTSMTERDGLCASPHTPNPMAYGIRPGSQKFFVRNGNGGPWREMPIFFGTP